MVLLEIGGITLNAIDVDLHTCFSWVGTGAFATKELVREFLQLTSAAELDSTEFHYSDMYFTTFMNQPPYQLESDLIELPQDHAFSGETNGIARNKYHIVCMHEEEALRSFL